MKTIKYISFLAIILLTITSCEDYLTKTIEFDEIGFEPVIVVNAKITDSLDYLDVSISKNINYANNSNPEYVFIDGATVKITVGGEEFIATELPENDEQEDLFNHRLDFPDGFILTGKSYDLEVTHPDYTTVTSKVDIATAPEISNIVLEKEARTGSDFGYPVVEDRITFTIKDQSDEINYYLIRTIIFQEFGESQPGTSSDNPAAVNIPFQFVLISDEDFDSDEYEISVYSENWGFGGDEVTYALEVQNISKSEFLFQQSFDKYQQSQDFGFFAEPTTLFSNIENGLGLFSAAEIFRYEAE